MLRSHPEFLLYHIFYVLVDTIKYLDNILSGSLIVKVTFLFLENHVLNCTNLTMFWSCHNHVNDCVMFVLF